MAKPELFKIKVVLEKGCEVAVSVHNNTSKILSCDLFCRCGLRTKVWKL